MKKFKKVTVSVFKCNKCKCTYKGDEEEFKVSSTPGIYSTGFQTFNLYECPTAGCDEVSSVSSESFLKEIEDIKKIILKEIQK